MKEESPLPKSARSSSLDRQGSHLVHETAISAHAPLPKKKKKRVVVDSSSNDSISSPPASSSPAAELSVSEDEPRSSAKFEDAEVKAEDVSDEAPVATTVMQIAPASVPTRSPAPSMTISKPDTGRATLGELAKGGLVVGGLAVVGFLAVNLLRKAFGRSSRGPSLPDTPLQVLQRKRAAALQRAATGHFGAVVTPLDLAPLASGPLDGLTFGIKDNLDVEGEVTGNGNPDWAATHPPATSHSPSVRLMLEAGARANAKLVMDELAYSLQGTNRHFGTPCNVACPERIPGGSSSGSAVAVASGLCDFALGTDTAGSVRVPAACCGIVGLRTTHDLVSRQGVCPLAPSLDTVGVFTRDLATMGRVARALLPSTPLPQEPVTPTKVLVALDLFLRCETEQLQLSIPALESALKALYGEAVVVGVSFCGFIVGALDNLQSFVTRRNTDGKADPLDALRQAATYLQQHEIFTCLGDFYRKHGKNLDASIQARFERAAQVTEEQFKSAVELRAKYAEAVASSLVGRTVLVMPTLPAYPPELTAPEEVTNEWRMRVMELTSVAGFGGFPQLTFPIGQGDDEAACPINISLVGGHGSEPLLIRLAEQMQPAIRSSFLQAQKTFRESVEEAQGEEEAGAGPQEAQNGGMHQQQRNQPHAAPAPPPAAQDPAKARAERLRVEGNDLFKAGKYQQAVSAYTRAIADDQQNSILYSNRAMARLKLLEWDLAKLDCDIALKLDPRSVKALMRRATASSQMGDFTSAQKDLEFALHLEPGNQQAKQDLMAVKNMLRQGDGAGPSSSFW